MGVVWKAEDSVLGRPVALKILPESFAGDPDRRARFDREARLLASPDQGVPAISMKSRSRWGESDRVAMVIATSRIPLTNSP